MEQVKIALVSANIGGIDNDLEIPAQTIPCDIVKYTENNLPFPLPNLDNRTKARYIKTQLHRFLPDYDFFIWLDARVEITSPNFVETMLQSAEKKDMVCTLHNQRENVIQEMEFIINQIYVEHNAYLKERYEHQAMDLEYEFYLKDKEYTQKGVFEYPLVASGIFGMWNTKENNEFCNEWWQRCLEFSNFDQAFFCYLHFKFKKSVKYLNYQNNYFKVGKHKPKSQAHE